MGSYKTNLTTRVLPALLAPYHARASSATDTSPAGVLSEVRANRLTYSEDFSHANWNKRGTAAVVVNDAVAPDGTATADKLTVGVIGNDFFNYVASIPASGVAFYPSLYIKRVTTTGLIRIGNPNHSAGGEWNVDLSLLSDSWERITVNHAAVTVITPMTGYLTNGSGLHIYAASGAPLTFHAWGAQVEIGATTDYMRTTTAARYMPAYDRYNGVVLEAARTNLIWPSNNLTHANWTATRASAVANQATGLDGTLSADALLEDTSTNTHNTYIQANSASTTVTFSVVLKPVGRTHVSLEITDNVTDSVFAYYTLTGAGAVGTPYSGGSWTGLAYKITALENGFYLCQITATRGAGTNQACLIKIANSSSSSYYAGDGRVAYYVDHAQLEVGAFASSRIITTTAAVTRAASYIGPVPLTELGIASQTNEYTVAVLVKVPFDSTITNTSIPAGQQYAVLFDLWVNADNRMTPYWNSSGRVTVSDRVAGVATEVVTGNLTFAKDDTLLLAISKGATNGIIVRLGAATVGTNATAAAKTPYASAITGFYLNSTYAAAATALGAYKAFRIWDRALTQAELEAITPASLLSDPARAPRIGIGYGIGL